ncbi:hypothetical protein GCM10023084_03290 [Streptomyces lacrimifluminis]|uniref:hypothetical protein n=1 Tax=Streptomyces lacrimifluminis TaxID=1500077 RepID=UPI0031EC7E0A
MGEQTPRAGRIFYYRGDGTLIRVVEDDDIEGFVALGEAVIDLADGAPAYDEGNQYKDMWHGAERV